VICNVLCRHVLTWTMPFAAAGSDSGKSMLFHMKLHKQELEAILQGKVSLNKLDGESQLDGFAAADGDTPVVVVYVADMKN
jgi:hypothetical protein